MRANNATISANGTTVNWSSGGGQSLVQALAGGLIQFTAPSTINNANGGVPSILLADGANSRIITDGLSISTGGSGGITAAKAQAGGNIQLTGGAVTFSGGGGNTGLLATGTNSAITATGVNISVGTGGGGRGVQADNAGSMTLSAGTTVTTTGAGTHAAEVTSGTLIMTGGTLTTNGAGANALNVSGGNATLAGVILTSPNAASIAAAGGTSNVALSGSTAIVNNGLWLNVNGGATLNLTMDSSTVQGAALTIAGSTSNVTLQNNSLWTMTGNSNVTNLTNSSSLVQFTPPVGDPSLLSSYKTLTAVNYTGQGGTLGLNTFLGADGSPSDRLIINGGSATGNSFLRITNAGGPGAETVANGIAVVQAINGGTTATGAFTLAGEVRGGAFDYFLFRGGLDGSSPNDWFLRSTFIVPPEPIEPPTVPLVPIGPSLPIDPPPGVLPPGVYPIIGPEIATYGVVQPIARQLGMTTLGTLHERTGDTSLAAITGTPCLTDGNTASGMPRKAPVKAPTDCRSAGWAPSVWGRVLGQQIDNHYRAFADPRASGQLLGFQSGIDLWRGEWMPGHRDAAGIYGGYANANVNVSGLVTNEAATGYVLRHTGGLNLNAWSGGAYWTHYGPGDWYVDAVAQATHYQGDANTQFASLSTTGFGFLSSLETGYPIQLPMFGSGFVLEPQAQVVWQHVSFDDANDGLGAIALGTTAGASGRIGLRGKWSIVSDSGELWQPYLRANLWRDWGARATAVYSGVDLVPLLEQATRLQLGGGVSVRMNANVSIYANADYQFAVGNTDGGQRDGIRGAAGVRYTW
ncbi:autotransporter outer membrane beta-barrel domain-containing protein [Bradyrhizobium sp. MOS002]|nr:autotransporter outer membrane beta-barrel domain-containing protein [Bradyrhizobium sp. MOS002]